MLPRPQDQPLRSAPGALQPRVVAGRRQRIRVPPGRHVHAGGARVPVVKTLGPDAELLPERIERAVRPLLEQIGLVVGMMAQRRVPGPPGHAGEPLGDVLGLQRRPHHRIGLGLRRGQCVAIGPGRLLQLERAGLADAGLPGIGEAAAVQHLRHQAGRIEAGQRRLRVRRVGQPHGADAPVAPGLRRAARRRCRSRPRRPTGI